LLGNVRCGNLKPVPRVACFTVAGLDLWFNSDDHLPPHFHAEKPGDWEVKVHFMRERSSMWEVVYNRPRHPTKGELKNLLKQAEAHRADLLREWETKVNVKTPGPAS
jgi:hypothetical protein